MKNLLSCVGYWIISITGNAPQEGENAMKKVTSREHYDLLMQEGNDPVNDPPILQDYMDKWDGQPFIYFFPS